MFVSKEDFSKYRGELLEYASMLTKTREKNPISDSKGVGEETKKKDFYHFHKDRAEEIVQDTFIEFSSDLDKKGQIFTDEKFLIGYLKTVLYRMFSKTVNPAYKNVKHKTREIMYETLQPVVDKRKCYNEGYQNLLCQDIYNTIERIGNKMYRDLLWCKVMEMDCEETAKKLGYSVNTVRGHRHEAVKAFKNLYYAER